MNKSKNEFGGRHFTADVILGGALVPSISNQLSRLERMLADRGVSVDHTTVSRGRSTNAPEIDKRDAAHLQIQMSWRVDEPTSK